MTAAEHPGTLLADLDEPSGPRTRFAVVADPHVATRSEGTSKLLEHTKTHFRAAIDDVATRDVDAVLSPGDLTKDGEPWNYDAVDDVLDALDAPLLAVPGNHDVPKAGDEHDTPSVAWFADQYAPGDLPFHAEVGALDVFGINTAGTADRLHDSHDGCVTQPTLDWLIDALEDATNPIVLAHHNLPPISEQVAAHQAIDPEMHLPPVLRDPDPYAEVLAAADVDLVLTGHYHLPATGTYRGVREVAAPTTCSFPQSYLLCETTPDGTRLYQVPVSDEVGLEHGHHERVTDSRTSAGLTAIAAARVASFPLVHRDAN